MSSARLAEADVERIADAMVAKLTAAGLAVPIHVVPTAALVEPLVWTPAQVAEHLNRSVDWVREHRHDLGVLPARGAKPRLYFDPAAVRRWATSRSVSDPSQAAEPRPTPTSHARRGRTSGTGVELLPIRGAA